MYGRIEAAWATGFATPPTRVWWGMLPDVLGIGLKVVFCGTAAGDRSARLGQYYAGARNKFWATLYDIGLTPRRLEPDEYELVLAYGMGLTDLAKQRSGSDRDLLAAISTLGE